MSIRPEMRRELMTLSAEERQELADELYESVLDEQQGSEWERAWSQELEHRTDDVLAGRVETIDAEDVHRELQAELSSARRR
jgi:putative addiction module component (TIGR02574 family)